MIVRPTADGFLVITQADHARFAADFLSLVRLPELIEHPQREELLRAVAEHDNGWWEADAAPRWDPETGAPLDFRRMPPEVRREIWARGVERYADKSPGVAARIATHALRLFDSHDSSKADPKTIDFVTTLERYRSELGEAAGLTSERLLTDDSWLRLADEVSLVACTADSTLVTSSVSISATASNSEGPVACELQFSPFLFIGTTRLPLRVRRLSSPFASARAVGIALASSSWETLIFRLAPAEASFTPTC